MKRSLSHLPLYKKQELKRLRSIILDIVPDVEFIILFGSHARGNWVDDEYMENHICYSYKSDFDILVITEDKATANNASPWAKIEHNYYGIFHSCTPLELISHHIQDVNTKLKEGHYFFTEIKRDGILLYNSGRHKLERRRRIEPKRRLEIAEEDFEQWFESAKEFYEFYSIAIEKAYYNKAAFELHQATERFYSAALLVCTGDKPKTHNIESLGRMAAREYPEFIKIFPKQSDEEKQLFKQLKNAYIGARYKKDYKITSEELTYLSSRVKRLRDLVEKVCKAKIEQLKNEIENSSG